MARLATSGCEIESGGNSTSPDAFFLNGTRQTSVVHGGVAACQGSGLGVLTLPISGALGTGYYARLYVQLDATWAFSHTATLLDFRDAISSGVVLAQLALNTDGTVAVRYGGAGGAGFGVNTLATSVSTLSTGVWYRLELFVNIGTGTVDALEGRIDGVTIGSPGSSLAISDIAPAEINGINNIDTGLSYMDDFALNDSTGAAQNSWPGSGKVVLLVPASDNAKGTGWTNDAAATTNLFDAVNNEPPVGIADTTTGSGLHQIRNATANANSNYDANMTTYAAAGIGASDTVNALVPVVATGAPVTTSAKQGTIGVSANPVITNVALGSGGTAGAFWSGVAAGTYPTGWKWSNGTTTYAPTVTLGSAPVMRITQVTSSTRIAMVCAMGMYVDYTSAVVIPPTPLVHQSIPFYPRASRPG